MTALQLDDPWTCPCGHELDPDTGQCVVWERDRNVSHLVPENAHRCSCHGLDARGWLWSR